jgi:3-methyladenine DNA glycosylase AlkD
VTSLSSIRTLLKAAARPKDVTILQRFFKTGKGEYGEGDVFIGVKVPDIRKVVAQSDGLTFDKVVLSLHSKIHEERLLALLIMVRRYQRAKDDKTKKEIVDVYLRERAFINNWDLVDGSARDILGPWLISRSRAILTRLAKSRSVWDRRIAVLTTFAFIRQNDFSTTLELAERLINDPHDLIHKAIGWMLREIGNRDQATLVAFPERHSESMPGTMFRYATKKLSQAQRARFRRGA